MNSNTSFPETLNNFSFFRPLFGFLATFRNESNFCRRFFEKCSNFWQLFPTFWKIVRRIVVRPRLRFWLPGHEVAFYVDVLWAPHIVRGHFLIAISAPSPPPPPPPCGNQQCLSYGQATIIPSPPPPPLGNVLLAARRGKGRGIRGIHTKREKRAQSARGGYPPWGPFSKVPKSFRDRKAITKSSNLEFTELFFSHSSIVLAERKMETLSGRQIRTSRPEK